MPFTPTRAVWLALTWALLSTAVAAPNAAAQELVFTIDAPAALEPVAARIRSIDRTRLVAALGRAGLRPPSDTRISLIADSDARARAMPRWIAAQASGARSIIIFPDRIGTYPHGSLEAVVRHEVVHLALFIQSGGRPLPRWFHEGTAVSVEEGWGIGSQLRLLLATRHHASLGELERLFTSDTGPEATSAYLLASALVSELRRRHGAAAPGAIAAQVGEGAPFRDAFTALTGDTPEAAASLAWDPYRRWASWIPVIGGATSVWLAILLLAAFAFAARRKKRARQRRLWATEDNTEDDTEDSHRRNTEDYTDKGNTGRREHETADEGQTDPEETRDADGRR